MTAVTTPWEHIPNAEHITRLLEHYKENPLAWELTWFEAARTPGRGAAWDAASRERRVSDQIWWEVRTAARGTAWWPCAALLAWDCAYILDMPLDAVRLLVAHDCHPAKLMVPAVVAIGATP